MSRRVGRGDSIPAATSPKPRVPAWPPAPFPQKCTVLPGSRGEPLTTGSPAESPPLHSLPPETANVQAQPPGPPGTSLRIISSPEHETKQRGARSGLIIIRNNVAETAVPTPPSRPPAKEVQLLSRFPGVN